jgi:hypothetical protein
MAGAAAVVPARVRVVEEIKNDVGTCDWASPPVVDLRLGITADCSYVVVIREVVQYACMESTSGCLLSREPNSLMQCKRLCVI